MKFKEIITLGDQTGQTSDKSINISRKNISSLEGRPKGIKGNFDCNYNKLTNLKYCPEIINGNRYA